VATTRGSPKRELVEIAAGFGKSRIAAMAAVVFLKRRTGKVHFIIPNEYLLKRDEEAFVSVYGLANSGEDRVKYHQAMDFAHGPDDLMIFDEGDVFIYQDPVTFHKFVG